MKDHITIATNEEILKKMKDADYKFIDDPHIFLINADGKTISIPLMYCPGCGKKLKLIEEAKE